MGMKRSRTVDLNLSLEDLSVLWELGWAVAHDPGGLPDEAIPAWTRMGRAFNHGTEVVYHVPRDSLQSFASAVRAKLPHDAQGARIIPAALAAVDARLVSRRGRPVTSAWTERADRVLSAARELEDTNGFPPTCEEVSHAIGEPPDVVRKWRFRHPELFPPLPFWRW